MNLISDKTFLIHMCNFFIFIFLIFSLILVIQILWIIPSQTPLNYTLIWSDDFNGTSLNTSHWRAYGHGVYQGGSNSDSQWDSSQVTVSNGQLHLGIAANPLHGTNTTQRRYIIGGVDNCPNGICSSPDSRMRNGKWETRVKMPSGFGTDGYFGLFDSAGGWPPEIDFAETAGKWPYNTLLTQINTTDFSKFDQTNYLNAVDLTADFHTYTFIWNGANMYWLIDGKVRKTSTQLFPPTDMKFGWGVWSGTCGGWPDCANPNILPAYMDIDYVRIYSKN